MLIFVAYLGQLARLCVSRAKNVNCGTESNERRIFHWWRSHFSADALLIGPQIKYSLLCTSKAVVLV